MPIVAHTHETITIPAEPDETFTIRKLTYAEREEARLRGTELKVKVLKFLPAAVMRCEECGGMGDHTELCRFQQLCPECGGMGDHEESCGRRRPEIDRIRRFSGYDPDTLVKFGLVGWSYDLNCPLPRCDHLNSATGVDDPACCDGLKLLMDAATVEDIAMAIFDRNVRTLGEGSGSGGSSSGAAKIASPSPENLPEPTSSLPAES